MFEYPEYVVVNNAGIPVGFSDIHEAVRDFMSNVQRKWMIDPVEKDRLVAQLAKEGQVFFHYFVPDSSTYLGGVFANPHKRPISLFLNAHLWQLPRSMEYFSQTLTAWEAKQGPRVGDYCEQGDKLSRFTYDWGDGIQTGGGNGSFWIGRGASVSYSGGLDASVPKERLVDTMKRAYGTFWFFKNGSAGAHRAVHIQLSVRVYKEVHDVATE